MTQKINFKNNKLDFPKLKQSSVFIAKKKNIKKQNKDIE